MKNATKINTVAIGTLAGLAGIEHGVGEILQGNVVPESVMIQSWPDLAVMEILNGEPAMTVVPNLLVTGILAILFSLVFLAWATLATRHRLYGPVLLLICIPMLLFGAGFGPPLLGLIIGAAATASQATEAKRGARRRGGIRDLLGRLWPWSLGACLAAWLAMLPGTVLLDHFWGIKNADLAYGLMAAMFLLLFLTILTGAARDSQQAG